MMAAEFTGVEFIVGNTDIQALRASPAPVKIQLGAKLTGGLGAGSNPEVGRNSALEDPDEITRLLKGADMVFITAGLGGGTGTGAAPVIAQLAREAGALTVGVVTKPFGFEGRMRARRAEQGLIALTEHVDTLITIPNEKLMSLADADMTFVEAFRKADEVLFQAVKGISDLIMLDGIVNVDFADVRTVMASMGRALMGTGCAKGEGRARLAAEQAICSPLLDNISVEGATGVLINVVGGPDMKMREIQEAASLVQEQAHEDANIIFGASIDETMSDTLKVTVIATGFQHVDAEIPVEVAREARRPERQSTASVVPAPRSQMQARPELREALPALSTRRPQAPSIQVHAAGNRDSQMSLPVRDRITFPSNLDTDWDTPAFQRRQNG
jgi:cell division protein FtsZ